MDSLQHRQELKEKWSALCAAMDAFRLCFEQQFAKTAPIQQFAATPPASALPTSDVMLDSREKQVLASFQEIANRAVQQNSNIQAQVLANPWGFNPSVVTSQLIEMNQNALRGYEGLRADASALADQGKPTALNQINAFIEDAKQALRTYGVVVTQNQAADAARAKIMSDAGRAAVGVMSAVNEERKAAGERTFNNMDAYIRG